MVLETVDEKSLSDSPEAISGRESGQLPGGLEIATFISATPLLVAAWRVYIVAGYDDGTLKAVIETINIPVLILGTFVTALPALVLALSVTLFMTKYYSFRVNEARFPWNHFFLYLAAMLFAFMLCPSDIRLLVLFAIIAIAPLLFAVICKWSQRRTIKIPAGVTGATRRQTKIIKKIQRLQQLNQWAIASMPISGLVGMLLAMSIASGMWLPTEIVTWQGSSVPQVGYVLNETDNQLVILMRDGQGVVRIDRNTLLSRTICRENSGRRPIFTWLAPTTIQRPRVVKCPEPHA